LKGVVTSFTFYIKFVEIPNTYEIVSIKVLNPVQKG